MLSSPRRQSFVPDGGPAKLTFGLGSTTKCHGLFRQQQALLYPKPCVHFHSPLWSKDHDELLRCDNLWRAVDQNGVVMIFLCNRSGTVSRLSDSSQAVPSQRSSSSAGDCNGQTAQLCGRQTGGDARRCSPAAPVPEQPRGELPSADAGAGEPDAAIQVRRPRPTLRGGARNHRLALPTTTPPALRG